MTHIAFKTLISSIIAAFSVATYAHNVDDAYIEKVRANASTFHKNFSTGDFDKNGALVNEKIYVNSNTAIVIGRDKFVNRIKRYHASFSKLHLNDRIVIVDGNEVGLLYIMQGTQDGPYGSIAPSGKKINVYAAEFFTMDDEARMKELLTITQLDRLVQQIIGGNDINEFEEVTLLPIKKTDAKYKRLLKHNIESFVQNFNARDWDGFKALLSDDVDVDWNGKKGVGKQAVKAGLETYAPQLPDLTIHLDRNIVEGDRGALGYTINGTYTSATQKGADGNALTKSVHAREGLHFQFNDSGKIIKLVAVSNSDEMKNQMK